jgi:hypothetical protein
MPEIIFFHLRWYGKGSELFTEKCFELKSVKIAPPLSSHS